MSTPTEQLAAFAADLDPGTIPDAVAADARRLLLDAIGSALIGWTSPESARVRDAAASTFGTGGSSVFGSGPLSPAGAAMVNGYLITARSFCDVHRPTLCHVTPVIVPPALTAAERGRTDGPTLLAGLVVGMEILLRIGTALDYAAFRGRGWHTPGVAGPMAGAAAAGRIMGLGSGVVAHAIGLGGTQGSGTFASLGSPAIKFHQARAAAAALMSADLAATGFTASTDILTHPDGGILGTYSNGGDPTALTRGLGSEWHLDEISTRRWPAAAALQPVIAAILDSGVSTDDVREISIGLPHDAFDMNADMGWGTTFEAMLSARWVAAVVIEDGRCWLDQFSSDRRTVRATTDRARSVRVELDPGLAEGAADVRITLTDGSTVRERREPDDPAAATWDATVEKFLHAADGTLVSGVAPEIIGLVDGLADVADVSVLTGLLAG